MLTEVALATEQMEKIKALPFANITSSDSQNFSGNFNKYSYSIGVVYVNPPNYDVNAGTATNYKRVQVNVTNSILPDIQTDLVTIVTHLDN